MSHQQLIIDILNPSNYGVIERDVKFGDPSIILSEIEYEINLEFDSENRVISYQKVDPQSNELFIEFEYDSGNLSKVLESYNGALELVWEMYYDDKKNYFDKVHSYKSFHSLDAIPTYALSNRLKREMANIPYFIDFKNQNNIIRIDANGENVRNYNYEYNELGYPITSSNPWGTEDFEHVYIIEPK